MTKTNGTKGRKRARTVTATKDMAQEATAPATDAQNAPVAPKGDKKRRARKPREELVVFAFRLTAQERDLIHQAAGPAKASRFIRNLAVTASKGDAEAVTAIVQAVKANS